MTSIPKLNINDFNNRFEEYLSTNPETPESVRFEAEVEKEAYEKLVQNWENAWDFDSQTSYFGGRGTSILIQNIKIDWNEFWKWLHDRTSAIPPGALINFEVYDSIKDDTMVSNTQLLRRVITNLGVFDEEDE